MKIFLRRMAFFALAALVVATLLPPLHAVSITPVGGGSGPGRTLLDSWSFRTSYPWTSDFGYTPVSYNYLDYSYIGNGASLVVDSTNQAWLQYNVLESDGTTNLTVDTGTVMFWFAPNWSSVSLGGTGPGGYARLLEAGSYTPDSSYGWWSLYVDPDGANFYFSTQTNDLSSNISTAITAPISWTTNYFHLIALTYSATNTVIYFDGILATNGPPLTNYPGADVLANGFYLGSDSNGLNQAHGLYNNFVTYDTPLDDSTIQQTFSSQYPYYMMNPWNAAMFKLTSATSSPSTVGTTNVITGQGNLQIIGSIPCVTNWPYIVWLTNVTATVATNGTVGVTFGIGGGQDGYFYDVFVGTSLTSPLGNGSWTWQGQGPHCLKYSLSGLPQGTIFIVLGTPQDTDGDGLTDAYESLISKTNPNSVDSNGDGIPDGWAVLLGLNPLGTDPQPRTNYSYTKAEWLTGVSGPVRVGSVTNDFEGNVITVSQ